MTDSATGTDADETESPTDANGRNGVDSAGAADTDEDGAREAVDADAKEAREAVDADSDDANDPARGAGWLAAEVASIVSASVAFALFVDGSTAVALPGASVSALTVTFWLLALAAVAAGGKATARGRGLRALGHGTLAVGIFALAVGGSVALVAVGGLTVTVGTLGAIVAVAGGNLVALDVVR